MDDLMKLKSWSAVIFMAVCAVPMAAMTTKRQQFRKDPIVVALLRE
jgi:hypothetical protein